LDAKQSEKNAQRIRQADPGAKSVGQAQRPESWPALSKPGGQYASRKEAEYQFMTKARTKRARARDPAGGLTAAGRAEFHRKQGAHLRPGVKKSTADMSLDDMRRKGSWAVRFYGRSRKLPPLIRDGKPTRYALSAAAWGEPIPKTEAAARRIAAKGRRLLERYAHKAEKRARKRS
jgi:hypothetical protein